MAGVNKVILVGHLGKDPEVRYTAAGVAVCNFTLATSESWKDKDGQKQERTEWHRISMFSKLAELAAEHLQKGRQVYLEGKLQTRDYQDKDGVKRYTTEILVNSMQFIGAKGEGQSRAPERQHVQQQEPQHSSRQTPRDMGYGEPGMDEDLPF